MHHAHMDLLAHDGIDREVDRIYRAFLDTTLAEFAKDSANTSDYREKVAAFRREHLEQKATLAFLYWFEVRAEHWSHKGADPSLVAKLAGAEQRDWLAYEAQAMSKRVDRVLALVGEWPGAERNRALLASVEKRRA